VRTIESANCYIVDQTRQEEKLTPIDPGRHASDSFRLRIGLPILLRIGIRPNMRPAQRPREANHIVGLSGTIRRCSETKIPNLVTSLFKLLTCSSCPLPSSAPPQPRAILTS
jgi:hypothetical protein